MDQILKIQSLINSGIEEGATLVAGGPDKPEDLKKGYFIKPTVFTDVNNNMRIAKEEIFGPVLSIIPFENEEEAIQITNDTEYGLGNYLQTEDKEKAEETTQGGGKSEAAKGDSNQSTKDNEKEKKDEAAQGSGKTENPPSHLVGFLRNGIAEKPKSRNPIVSDSSEMG